MKLSYLSGGIFFILLGGIYFYFLRHPVDDIARVHSYNVPDKYDLYDPEMAPEEIRDQVVSGFQMMIETKKLLPQYAGNDMNCRNCHFNGGNSMGGRSCGFSLVGVVHKYPRKLPSGKEYTLEERVNSCFMRSMNGKPLPVDSKEMQALVTYMEWISNGIPKLESYPWLGAKKLTSSHVPDPKRGEKLFAMKCAPCHGENGEGQKRPYQLDYPPLWGNGAFNDGAGMSKLDMFAYFIYKNMPYNDPRLSVEEALDIASYVTKQPRPKLENHE